MSKYFHNFSHYGIVSGTCAAAGSIFGKLSGSTDVFSSDNVSVVVVKCQEIELKFFSEVNYESLNTSVKCL